MYKVVENWWQCDSKKENIIKVNGELINGSFIKYGSEKQIFVEVEIR